MRSALLMSTALALAAASLGACQQQSNPSAGASAPVAQGFSLTPRPAASAAARAPANPATNPSPVVQISAPAAPASSDPLAAAIEQAAIASAAAPAAAAPATTPTIKAPTATTDTPAPVIRAPSAEDAATPVSARAGAAHTDRNLLIRAEVLLDRAHFSPGVIDGRNGSNLRNAVTAYQSARRLPVTGQLDAATWQALAAADATPVTQDYVITAQDVAGPFHSIPTAMTAMARLPRLGYATPREALAERFHMDERLLAALNPNADFTVAGTRILVVQPASTPLPEGIARIEVDKSHNQVRALDAQGLILAAFPATVGSTERPAPTGEVTVRAVAPNPTYTYDPSRLTFGNRSGGRLTIPAGPNNPVGSTWIDLSEDTYGIHGTPNPADVGKTASHGCVRLTNWDAAALGRAVRAGLAVVFVGTETRGA